MERHHWVAVVVGLLDKALPFAGQRQAPDVTGTDARGLEEATIGAEARHAGVREVGDVALRGGDLARIKSALRQPEPTPRGPRELVREKVRILHAEAREQELTLVGFAVTVGVTKKDDVMTVLHDSAVLIGQDAFRDSQTISEGAWLTKAWSERLVEDDDLIAGLGFIKRFGGGWVLVSVHRVLQGGARPSPSLLIEDEHDELTEVGGLLGEKLDFETLW